MSNLLTFVSNVRFLTTFLTKSHFGNRNSCRKSRFFDTVNKTSTMNRLRGKNRPSGPSKRVKNDQNWGKNDQKVTKFGVSMTTGGRPVAPKSSFLSFSDAKYNWTWGRPVPLIWAGIEVIIYPNYLDQISINFHTFWCRFLTSKKKCKNP